MNDSTVVEGVDYGPLAGLIGHWRGDRGVDVAPEPTGQEENSYWETLFFEPIGSVGNAGAQTLAVLRYHQVVHRHSNNEVFHNETGYWHWDGATDTVCQSLSIPRGVCVLAGGGAQNTEGGLQIDVSAAADDPDWGIIQSPFMRDKATTTAFNHRLLLTGDTLVYCEMIMLDIYGKVFEHRDQNTLQRSSG